MKITRYLFPVIALGMSSLTLQAAAIVSNSFENIGTTAPGDDWAYSVLPTQTGVPTFNETGNSFGPTTSLTNFDFNTAPDGNRFFGQRGTSSNSLYGDLGFDVRAWVKFDSIDISALENVKVSFFWSGESNFQELGYFLAGTTDGSEADFTPEVNRSSAANTSVMDGTTSLITSTVLAGNGGGGFLQDWVEVSFDIDDSYTRISFALFGSANDSTSRLYGWDDVQLTAIPEPGTIWLMAGGLLAVGFFSSRRRNR